MRMVGTPYSFPQGTMMAFSKPSPLRRTRLNRFLVSLYSKVRHQRMLSLNSGPFVLRPVSDEDAPSIVEAVRESTATVGAWMSWATPSYSHAEAIAWIRACETSRAEGTGYEFGIFTSATGRFVGAAGLNQFNKVNNFCNLGYWVRESAQRRGRSEEHTSE